MSKVFGYQFPRGRGLRTATILGAAMLVQGCAGGFPQFSGPRAPAAEQVVIPEPVPTTPQTNVAAATRKPPPNVRKSTPVTPAKQDLSLNVLYYVRVMVPVGSDLTVRADSASGGAPSIKSVKTEGGPPYAVEIPVSAADDAFPMTVDAVLESSIGHVLEGSVTLDEAPAKPIEIVLVPKAE